MFWNHLDRHLNVFKNNEVFEFIQQLDSFSLFRSFSTAVIQDVKTLHELVDSKECKVGRKTLVDSKRFDE